MVVHELDYLVRRPGKVGIYVHPALGGPVQDGMASAPPVVGGVQYPVPLVDHHAQDVVPVDVNGESVHPSPNRDVAGDGEPAAQAPEADAGAQEGQVAGEDGIGG